MRKYRGLTKEGKWVYGWYKEDTYGKPKILAENPENHFLCWFFVRPETVGQSTGLKDKNGTEIYEGDIIKYTRVKWECFGHPEHLTDLVQIHEIYWDDEIHGFCDSFTYKTGGGASGTLGFQDNRAKKNIIEVIGNRHQNPELLENSK